MLKVYCSSFSAVATCTFNWPMIDNLRNKDELREGSTYFQVQWIKEKRKHGKYSVEVYSGKYSTQYMRIIWILQCEFADSRINWFTL